LRLEKGQLINEKHPGAPPLPLHRISKEKGRLIKNRNHMRHRAKGIPAYVETAHALFEDKEKSQQFLDEIPRRYPRYIRDQLQIIQKTVKQFEPYIGQALDTCAKNTLWSANDLRDVAAHLAKTRSEEHTSE